MARGGKFAVECELSSMISYKCLFRPKFEFFWQKNQKIFNVGKHRKYDEKERFLEKKRFHLFLKAFFTKMERRKICRW